MLLPVRARIRPFFEMLRRGPFVWLFVAGTAALAATAQSAPPAPQTPQAHYLVVLDAAHGGDDPGARLGNGQPEKTFTLALSVRLRSLLNARGIQVVTTRESDATLDPDKRAEIANHAQAQACLVLHASESGSGVHLFVSSMSSVQRARFVAWKTAQASWIDRSLALTGALNSALQHAGMNVTLGRTSLAAVDSMTCPAVAVEIAPERAGQTVKSRLDDPAYQARVAEALAAALLVWRTEDHRR
jgi:N-acetylmuramoyl-L-alanine amidase